MDLLPGARVGVVEPKPPAQLDEFDGTEDPDIRVFAITPATANILNDCYVWNDITNVRAPEFRSMQVWESVGSGYVRFGGSIAPPLGYVVENRVLASAVYDRLRHLASSADRPLTLLEGSGLAALDMPPHSVVAGVRAPPAPLATATLEDGRTVRARLVVGADGGASRTRSLAGVGSWSKDYEQRGVVASLVVSAPDNRTAWQRFLPSGPLALLPMGPDRASMVWSASPAEAARLSALGSDQLADEINAALAAPPSSESGRGGGADADGGATDVFSRGAVKLSRAMQGAASSVAPAEPLQRPPRVVSVIGSPASFPLRMAGANEYARPRLALVGDAAHTIHPLAGQGLNLGIGDAEALAKALARGQAAGRDLGSLSLLREYDGERRAQVQGMQTALDIIKAVFAAGGARAGVPSAVRTAGMAAIHSLGPLKGEMAAFAMGSDSSAASKVVSSVGAFLNPSFGSSWGSGR